MQTERVWYVPPKKEPTTPRLTITSTGQTASLQPSVIIAVSPPSPSAPSRTPSSFA